MMKLSQLFENVPDIEVSSLMADSRQKRKNAIFFCIVGRMYDGHKFIGQAIDHGAIAIVHSEELDYTYPNIVYIRVKNVIDTFNKVANAFYGYPSQNLFMFAVTGTNGKSSIASIIKQVMDHHVPTGYIGTIGVEYGNVKQPPLLTTPNIDDIHGLLKEMVEAQIKCCSIEASSIGIEQGRLDAVDVDVAIFTNLTHDHLDYHRTMYNYFEAKKRLFDRLKETGIAIINIDDPYGKKMVQDCHGKIITYGIDQPADYQIVSYTLKNQCTKFKLKVLDQIYEVETNLVAKFNLYNVLACIAAMHSQGLDMEKILPYLSQLKQIEGRMEQIQMGQPFNVIVDFAHTPDGIEKVCQFATSITPKENRIIVVCGSAGRRDGEKRIQFGQILDRYCDMIILTEDDPRDENPQDIAQQIARGIEKTNYVILCDRYDAIRQAIELANSKDTILILGKGDERFMYRMFDRVAYDGDDAIVKEVISKYYFYEGEPDEEEQVY